MTRVSDRGRTTSRDWPVAVAGAIHSTVAPNIYDAVKQALQDLIAPQLESIKGEIGELRGEMRSEIGTLRGEMHGEIGTLRGEMHGEIGTLRGELGEVRTEIGALRSEMRGELVAVRSEIGEVRAEMRGNHAALTSEIRRIDDKLTWALDLRERIVALETKLGS